MYYHDTDCGQVVYYANYLKYFEEARTELLRECSIDLVDLSKEGYVFVVRNVNIDYKSPARYGDLLDITSCIKKIKSASLIFEQKALRGKDLLVGADTVLVCVGSDFRPSPMPERIIELLKS